MKNQYLYHDPRKVIEHGELIYRGDGFGKVLKIMPKVDSEKILIGMIAPVHSKDAFRVGALEITDEKVYQDFKSSCGGSWSCSGGTSFLYTLPKEKAEECRIDNNDMQIIGRKDLEGLTQNDGISVN